jgi:hypothetical protein
LPFEQASSSPENQNAADFSNAALKKGWTFSPFLLKHGFFSRERKSK